MLSSCFCCFVLWGFPAFRALPVFVVTCTCYFSPLIHLRILYWEPKCSHLLKNRKCCFPFFKFNPGGCPFEVMNYINNRVFNNAVTEPEPRSEVSIARTFLCNSMSQFACIIFPAASSYIMRSTLPTCCKSWHCVWMHHLKSFFLMFQTLPQWIEACCFKLYDRNDGI